MKKGIQLVFLVTVCVGLIRCTSKLPPHSFLEFYSRYKRHPKVSHLNVSPDFAHTFMGETSSLKSLFESSNRIWILSYQPQKKGNIQLLKDFEACFSEENYDRLFQIRKDSLTVSGFVDDVDQDIIQEAVFNIHTHSGFTSIRVAGKINTEALLQESLNVTKYIDQKIHLAN